MPFQNIGHWEVINYIQKYNFGEFFFKQLNKIFEVCNMPKFQEFFVTCTWILMYIKYTWKFIATYKWRIMYIMYKRNPIVTILAFGSWQRLRQYRGNKLGMKSMHGMAQTHSLHECNMCLITKEVSCLLSFNCILSLGVEECEVLRYARFQRLNLV